MKTNTPNTPHFKKYGELPMSFITNFNRAYEDFWKRRNMPVPDASWKGSRERSWNERQLRKNGNG